MAASNSQFAALLAPPKASDGGRSVRLSLSFAPLMLATDTGGLFHSVIVVGELEAPPSKVPETAVVIRSNGIRSNFDQS